MHALLDFMLKNLRHVVPRDIVSAVELTPVENRVMMHDDELLCDLLEWLPQPQTSFSMGWVRGWVVLRISRTAGRLDGGTAGGLGFDASHVASDKVQVLLKFYSTLGSSPLLLLKGKDADDLHYLKVRPWISLSHDTEANPLTNRTILVEHGSSPGVVLRFENRERQEQWARALIWAKVRSASATDAQYQFAYQSGNMDFGHKVNELYRQQNFQRLREYVSMMADESGAPGIMQATLKPALRLELHQPLHKNQPPEITQIIFRLTEVFFQLTLEGGTVPLCTSVMLDARWRQFTEAWARFIRHFFSSDGTFLPDPYAHAVLGLLLCFDIRPPHAVDQQSHLATYLQNETVVGRANVINNLIHAMLSWASSSGAADRDHDLWGRRNGLQMGFHAKLNRFLKSRCFHNGKQWKLWNVSGQRRGEGVSSEDDGGVSNPSELFEMLGEMEVRRAPLVHDTFRLPILAHCLHRSIGCVIRRRSSA